MEIHEITSREELANEARLAGEKLKELIASIETRVDAQHLRAQECHDVVEMQRLADADPYQWLTEAKHALQAGLMFADRAINQPTTF